MTPNTELAYRVLDTIDADPAHWNQRVYVSGCGTSFCFAGWALVLTGHKFRDFPDSHDDEVTLMELDGSEVTCGEVEASACQELGITKWAGVGLFDGLNTRTELGQLVAEYFGPRPVTP